jgi:hypothetical protein
MMEACVLRKNFTIGIFTMSILAMARVPVWAEADEGNPAALANALPEASVMLDKGLKASERAGNPISGNTRSKTARFSYRSTR